MKLGVGCAIGSSLGVLYRPPPVITSVLPATGATTGNTVVTLSGTGFQPGMSVYLGGTLMSTATFLNATTIQFTTPNTHTGTSSALAVRLVNPDLQETTAAAAFTYAAPFVGTPFPATGPLTGGQIVVIPVTNCGANPTITIGGTSATVLSSDQTQVTVSTPTGSAGVSNIVVTNTDAVTSGTSGNSKYTFATAANAIARNVDFTQSATYTPGFMTASGFLTASGLTFTRASGASDTVQTNASTVATGSANDTPRIGGTGASWGTGFVFEEPRLQYLKNTRSIVANWVVGSGTATAGQIGPDGTANAAEVSVPSGTFSSRVYNTSSNPVKAVCASQWVRAVSGTCNTQWNVNDGVHHSSVITNGVGTTWTRQTQKVGFQWSFYIFGPNDSRLWGAPTGSQVAQALDYLIDFPQIEMGFGSTDCFFSTEAIVSTTVAPLARAAERVRDTTLSHWLASGLFAIEMQFVPKGALTDYTANIRFWAVDANTYAEITPAGIASLTINGTTYSSTTNISWSAGDVVKMFWTNSRSIALVAISTNGSACTTLVSASATTVSTSSTALEFCSDGAGGKVLSAWHLTWNAYADHNAPYWYAPSTPTPTSLDFTTATTGPMTASSFATTYLGVTFSRASTATTQKSASTIDTTAQVDYPRFVDFGFGWKGLLVEESRTNLLTFTEALTNAALNGTGTGTKTGSQTGPDGATNATKLTCTSGNKAPVHWTVATPPTGITASLFAKTTAASGPVAFKVADSGSNFTFVSATGTSTYGRYSAYASWTPTGSLDVAPADGGTSGGTAQALDYTVDFPQLEAGLFPTSPIICSSSSTVTRSVDKLAAAQPASWVANGRFAIELNLVALAAGNEFTSNARLYTINSNNYAEYNASTQVLNVAVAGVVQTFTSMSWARLDELDIFIAAGGGLSTTQVQYRRKGAGGSQGDTFVLVPQSAAGTVPTPLNIDICSSGGSLTLSSVVKKVKAYTDGTVPSWCLPVPMTTGAATHNLVTEGDSLTEGYGVTTGQPWVAVLQTLIGSGYATIQDIAISGSRVFPQIAGRESTAIAKYNAAYAKNIITLWAGTNDIALDGADDLTAYNRIVSWCTDMRNAGYDEVIVATMLYRSANLGPGITAAQVEVMREGGTFNSTSYTGLNPRLRNAVSPPWTRLLDLGADPVIGTVGWTSNLNFCLGDGVHINVAGHARVASAFYALLKKIG